jgi:hypothetical protein
MLLFSIYEELTDVVCVPEVGSCAIGDLNMLVLMAGQESTSGKLLVI